MLEEIYEDNKRTGLKYFIRFESFIQSGRIKCRSPETNVIIIMSRLEVKELPLTEPLSCKSHAALQKLTIL